MAAEFWADVVRSKLYWASALIPMLLRHCEFNTDANLHVPAGGRARAETAIGVQHRGVVDQTAHVSGCLTREVGASRGNQFQEFEGAVLAEWEEQWTARI